MKKLSLVLLTAATLAAVMGANIETSPKKTCYGYTIIEFGKGIDCNGDTVKLVKVKGGQQLLVGSRQINK